MNRPMDSNESLILSSAGPALTAALAFKYKKSNVLLVKFLSVVTQYSFSFSLTSNYIYAHLGHHAGTKNHEQAYNLGKKHLYHEIS